MLASFAATIALAFVQVAPMDVGVDESAGDRAYEPALQLSEFLHATPLNALGAERTAGREIPSSLLCIVRLRHHESGVDGRKFASACLSAWPENSRICSHSRPIAFGSSVPFQALFRARLLVGFRRPTHSSAGRRIVRRRRKAMPRGAHSTKPAAPMRGFHVTDIGYRVGVFRAA
jgi:hypothetical protein